MPKQLSSVWLVLAPFLALASCQQPVTVLLSPEAAALRADVQSAVTGAPGLGKVTVTLESATAPSGPLLRLTSTPGWNLPSGLGPAVPIPAGWDPSYQPLPAFAALGQAKDLSWSSIPLLYDVWGLTTFAAKAKSQAIHGDWKELLNRAALRSLSVAGSRPSFRQAAYLFAVFPDVPGRGEAAAWFPQTAQGWKAPAIVLPALVVNRAWLANSWFFTQDDQAVSYKPGRPIVFLETYRNFEQANPPGVRRFVPLTVRQGTTVAMAGTVLFLEYRGSKGGLDAALKVARSLAGMAFQREAGAHGKWLSVDQSAPELDVVGAMVRRMSSGAARFFPVSDRLPDTLVEGNLWAEVQLAVDRAPRK
ncbi:MAG TPA: hypothetical protein VMM82_04810 [Spirochaetia bacterium]|nr:hypothetical protein [Spirochaetia bacterium]